MVDSNQSIDPVSDRPVEPAPSTTPASPPPEPLGGPPTNPPVPASKLAVTSVRARLLLGLQLVLIFIVAGTALAVVQAIFADWRR